MGKGCTPARRYLAVLGTVSAVIAAGVVIVPVIVAGAAPPLTTLVVNSLAWGGADANPGDGVCETVTGNNVCTLRAAITESNALNGQPGEIEIVVHPSFNPGTKMTGGTPNQASMCMITTNLTAQDSGGAYFNVTSPVTIDLGHRLEVDGSGNDHLEYAAFYLNGPDINVFNADNVMASGSSFVIGPNANRVTIDGDTAGGFARIRTPNWNPERFVVFREGASNVAVRNYQITGYLNNTNDAGIFVFDSYSPYTAMTNITVDQVQVLYSLTGSCNGSDGLGCHTRLTNFWSGNSTIWNSSHITINGLTFTNMLIQNMPSRFAFYFGDGNTSGSNSIALSNVVIDNNVFLNNQGNGVGFITLPYANKLTGTNSISNNVFTRASSGNNAAIYYYGAAGANSTAASGLTIANNHFNGYTGNATIFNRNAGLVTVRGNTFGPGTASQAVTSTAPGITEEYADPASLMYATHHSPSYSTNQSIRTWAPLTSTPASVLTGAVPHDAVVMDDPRDGAYPTCPATVQVTKITDTNNTTKPPGEPVTLQAYWTASSTAEVYLGEVDSVVGASATLVVQLPVGTIPLRDGTSATVVNPTSGEALGYIRLQTHDESLAQVASSQYSRAVAVSGNCRPVLTLNQASGMADPTYGRDVHFTVSSTVPLDPGTVTVDDFDFHATGVAQTIDASRLNPRIVSIEPVPGSDDRQFDMVLRVDDSAAVSVTMGAGKVATAAGLTNQTAATYTDNTITFLNPLQVNPSSFTLVTGEPQGKSFTIGVAGGAPPPTADVMFTATVDQPDGTPAVWMSTTGPVLQSGQTSTAPVIVKAGQGEVIANTEVTITMTVESSDTNYDGLVVPTLTPYLFSTDPTIQVVKRAYTDVGDTSLPERIEATGTLAPAGTRLMDQQAVCFVYTVSNVSTDDWTTTLTTIEVTDSDTRLGASGLIGTIASLTDGDSAKLSWCTSLLPVDTTVGS